MIIYDRGEPLLLKLRRQIVHAKREDVEQAAEQIDFGEAASAKARGIRLAPACERGPAAPVQGRGPEVASNGIRRPDREASENGKHPDPEAHRSHHRPPAVACRGLGQDAATALRNSGYRSIGGHIAFRGWAPRGAAVPM